MDYYDEELLELKREQERQGYTTLETGIYVDDELITFSAYTLPGTSIRAFLPRSFVIMPEEVKAVKYPYANPPDFIYTNLAGTVNLGFNLLPEVLEEGEAAIMSSQLQKGLKNINPSIRFQNRKDEKTAQGNEMSWFEYNGYNLDGRNFNRMYLIRMRKLVLHGIFNCMIEDKKKWEKIVELIFQAIEEEI